MVELGMIENSEKRIRKLKKRMTYKQNNKDRKATEKMLVREQQFLDFLKANIVAEQLIARKIV